MAHSMRPITRWHHKIFQARFCWIFGALFFLMEYFIRISPSVIDDQLASSFHADALMVGIISAMFYYAYIIMQVPVGMLIDRYGPYRLMLISILICGLSILLFSTTHNYMLAIASRFLSGFSAAFAFVGTLKLISNWLPAKHFALLAGITQASGMIGAAIGDAPMAKAVSQFGWRQTNLGIFFLFLILAILFALFVRDRPKNYRHNQSKTHTVVNVLSGLQTVLKNKQTWLNSIFIGMLYGPTAAFGGMWGVTYLSLYYHETIHAAAVHVGLIFIGMVFGNPFFGWWSDRWGKRLPVMRISCLSCFALLALSLYGHQWFVSTSLLYVILFIYGFCNAGITPSYAVASEINSRQLMGISLGITNMASILIGSLSIPLIGHLIDLQLVHHHLLMPALKIHAFQLAFVMFSVYFLVAFLVSFWIKETNCKSINNIANSI